MWRNSSQSENVTGGTYDIGPTGTIG
jgi:hypothetical protein